MGARAVWKGPFLRLSLLQAIQADRNVGKGIRTQARSSTIIPDMVGALLHVHNGHHYLPVRVREEMVGMRVGQLVATKKPFSYRATNANKRAR